MCCGQMRSCFSLFWEKQTMSSPCQRWNGPSWLLSVKGAKASVCHGMDDFHICEGSIDADVKIGILERRMLPSKQCLFPRSPCLFQQDNAGPHSACAKTVWLCRHRMCAHAWLAGLQSKELTNHWFLFLLHFRKYPNFWKQNLEVIQPSEW